MAAAATPRVDLGVPDDDEPDSPELRERLYQQWSEGRAARRAAIAQLQLAHSGEATSDFRRAKVPYGVDLTAAWSWRFLVISGALAIVLYLLNLFLVVVLPIVIALLLAALATPMVHLMSRWMPRKLAALLTVVVGLVVIGLLLTFVGSQVASGFNDLSNQVVTGLGKIREWLKSGPLHASDSQIDSVITQAQETIANQGKDSINQVTEVGTALGHVVAGLFIVLFSTYFFLADGHLIWAWLVRLFPRAGRRRADSSGRVAWVSLTQFVRATVLVAGTDAIGVVIVAAILGLPFLGAIGVLVFLGAFVPMIGAFVSGTVAVLVALVAKGPVAALLMFIGVVVVQQIEAHVLQPFLMGRFVSVHPLGVIVAIALGVIVAGIPGALVAVPLAASLNAVGQHLASYTDVGEDADPDADLGPPGTPSDGDADGSDGGSDDSSDGAVGDHHALRGLDDT